VRQFFFSVVVALVMSLSQPSNIYVSSADSEQLAGPGSFIANLGGGVMNLTSIELTEFQTYNLFPTFPANSVIAVEMRNTVAGWAPQKFYVPIPDSINNPFSSPEDMRNALNVAFTRFGEQLESRPISDPTHKYWPMFVTSDLAINTSFWSLALGKLAYVFPSDAPYNGYEVKFARSGPYVTENANKWLGVRLSHNRANDWADAFQADWYFALYPQIVRTTVFYVRCSLNSADSITVQYGVRFADRTILAKIPNTAVNRGDAIFYQPTIPDPVSKNAIGSSVYEVQFQLLDDRFQLMTELPDNCVIHMSFRCQYEGKFSSSS
jgi:hypothetical protein